MANAHYYGSLFKSNGTATAAPTVFDATLPASSICGEPLKAKGTLAFTAALATTDTSYLARVPANHRVCGLRFQYAEIDSGTTVTVNVGTAADGTTYDDADAYIAASILFRAAAGYSFPTSGATGTGNPTTWNTGPAAAGTPNIDYNVVLVLAAGPSTATSGTIYYEIDYVADVTVYDNNNSPAVVTS